MALVTWNDQYRTGVLSIDEAHEQLFRLLNQLHEDLRAGRRGAQVALALETLREHAASHFQDEEAHMAASGFPGLAAHQVEHVELMGQIKAFQRRQAAEPDAVGTGELGVFLVDWVMHHVLGIDRQYTDSLKAPVEA